MREEGRDCESERGREGEIDRQREREREGGRPHAENLIFLGIHSNL